jgi:excisionase family DNA binding protein
MEVHLEPDRMLYRVEEAAAVLALSRHRLYELIRSGELPTVKIGNLRRVPAQSMVAYVEGLLLEVGRHDDHAA